MCVCSNRKLHEIAAFLNLVTTPMDDADDVYSSEFLLELLVFNSCYSVCLHICFLNWQLLTKV